MTRNLLTCSLIVAFLGGCGGQGREVGGGTLDEESASGTVTVDGIDLRYVAEGTGIPCIVYGSSVYYPRTFSHELRDEFRLVFADSRFFALSDDDSVNLDEISMDVLVDDLEEVRKSLGLEQVAVLGHSMFALVVLEYAKKYPSHVSHVIMVAMSPSFNAQTFEAGSQYWESEATDNRKALWERNVGELEATLSEASPSEAFVHSYVADGPRRWYRADYDASPLWEGVEFHGDLITYFLSNRLSGYQLGHNLDRVTMPVFLAVGKYDFGIPPHLWDEFQDDFSDLSYNVFERSGHHPMLEEPELFDQRLIGWIKGE